MSNVAKKVLLRKDQVRAGMTVTLWVDGKDKPEQDKNGQLIMKALIGGIKKMELKMIPVESVRATTHRGINGEQNTLVSVTTLPLEKFRDDIRFQPLEVFSPEDAPSETEFVIIIDGELVSYKDEVIDHKYAIRIIKRGGEFKIVNHGIPNIRYKIAKANLALLIATGKIAHQS